MKSEKSKKRAFGETSSKDSIQSRRPFKSRYLPGELEKDERRLAQRQKQIDFGKNTVGYDRYCSLIPRNQRRRLRYLMTPDKHQKMGKRQWDQQIRRWRQFLHRFDPEPEESDVKESPTLALPSDPQVPEKALTPPPTTRACTSATLFADFDENEQVKPREPKETENQDDDDDDDLL